MFISLSRFCNQTNSKNYKYNATAKFQCYFIMKKNESNQCLQNLFIKHCLYNFYYINIFVKFWYNSFISEKYNFLHLKYYLK